MDSSWNQGSAAACVPLDSEWWQNVGKRIPNVHRAHRVRNCIPGYCMNTVFVLLAFSLSLSFIRDAGRLTGILAH